EASARVVCPLRRGNVGAFQLLWLAGASGVVSHQEDWDGPARRVEYLCDLYGPDLFDPTYRWSLGRSIPRPTQGGLHRRHIDGARPICAAATLAVEPGVGLDDRRQWLLQAQHLDDGGYALSSRRRQARWRLHHFLYGDQRGRLARTLGEWAAGRKMRLVARVR